MDSMPNKSPRPGLPRGGLPRGDGIEAVILWIALALAALFTIAQVGFAVTYVPVMLHVYDSAGLEVGWVLGLADMLGPLGIVVALTTLDIVLFAATVWAARRYWVGLLFISPLLYLLVAFVIFASGFGGFPTLIR